MKEVAKIFSYIAFVFAFCFMAVGYAAVQDTLTVSGTVSVEAQNEPFAVYGTVYASNGADMGKALNFYNRPIVQAGDEIPLGEGWQEVDAVYTSDAWSFNKPEEQPWRFDLEGIESIKLIASVAVIDDNIQPTKTRSWFADFTYCTTFDLAKLDTSKVTEMGYMFKNCTLVQHLDLSRFKTSGLVDYGMDEICMSEMFYGCSNLETLDISLFENGPVISFLHMFSNCGKLTTIYAGDGFDGYLIQEKAEPAFDGCTSLIGGKGTRFDSSKNKADYARIDGLDGLPGYFTCKHIYENNICTVCDTMNVTSSTELTAAKASGKDYIVSGGTYTPKNGYSDTNIISADGVNVTVNDATTESPAANAFAVLNGGTLTLNNVIETSNPNRAAIATVSGGTLIINSGEYSAASIAMGNSSGIVKIYGGTFNIYAFNGMAGMGYMTVGTMEIYGGTFNMNPQNQTGVVIGSGCTVQSTVNDNGDEIWTVVAAE